MPLLAYLPLGLLLAGWIYTTGKLVTVLTRLEAAFEKLADKVDDHETRVSRIEGARR